MADKTTKTSGPAGAKPRVCHLLVEYQGLAIVAIVAFTGELAARRALDNRGSDWRYVQLAPGTVYTEGIVRPAGDA